MPLINILIAAASISLQSAPPKLLPLDQVRIEEFKKVQDIRDKILAVDPYAGLVPTELFMNPALREMGLSSTQGSDQLNQALGYRFDKGVLQDLHPIDFTSNEPMLGYAVPRSDANGVPSFMSFKDGFKDLHLAVYKVKVTEGPLLNSTPAAPTQTVEIYVGILDKEDLSRTLKRKEVEDSKAGKKLTAEIEEETGIPVHFYANSHDQIFAVLDKAPSQPLIFPDRPEFVIVKGTPAGVTSAFKTNKRSELGIQEISWAVKEPQGIVDFEHVRREAFMKLQHLREGILAQHPTKADFPPEMLTTPEFLATGLHPMENQRDELTFLEALSYKPEGRSLVGFHPIDYTKDKAAKYSTVTTSDGTDVVVNSLKDTFAGKKVCLFKLRLEVVGPKGDKTVADSYFGPTTPETVAELKMKAKNNTKITELKDEDVPLSIFTNDAGAVEFVLAYRPKDLLLIDERPFLLLSDQPVEKVKPLAVDAKDAATIPRLPVGYAIEEN